jgi:hypothetical protein
MLDFSQVSLRPVIASVRRLHSLFGSAYQFFATVTAFSSVFDHRATPKHFYEFETRFYVLS